MSEKKSSVLRSGLYGFCRLRNFLCKKDSFSTEQYWQLMRQFISLHSSFRLVYVIVGIK
jgi:hypothetical protein